MSGDWRAAFDIYVAGRNHAVTTAQKREMARRSPILAEDSSRGATGDTESTGVVEEGRHGVGVPAQFTYHRNAGTWREPAAETRHDG